MAFNNNLSPQDFISNIQHFLQQENQNKLLNSLKEIHRADIAEIIQSLNTETR